MMESRAALSRIFTVMEANAIDTAQLREEYEVIDNSLKALRMICETIIKNLPSCDSCVFHGNCHSLDDYHCARLLEKYLIDAAVKEYQERLDNLKEEFMKTIKKNKGEAE